MCKLSACVLGSNYRSNARTVAIGKEILLNIELRKKKEKHIAAKYNSHLSVSYYIIIDKSGARI